MSIQPDSWIKKMCKDHKMIEPFAESQVRREDDEALISYGTSSFGYDVRCAREFKIFTNINSAIVDPKAFDDNSFDCIFAIEVMVHLENPFLFKKEIKRIIRETVGVKINGN